MPSPAGSSPAPTPRSSTWDATGAPFLPPSGGHYEYGTATAASPTAGGPGTGVMPITSNTGPSTTGLPTSATSVSSAATTMCWFTKVAGPFRARPNIPSSSARMGGSWPPDRRDLGSALALGHRPLAVQPSEPHPFISRHLSDLVCRQRLLERRHHP